MPDAVRITDVSPRDGLQNESTPIPTARKADLVRALFNAKLDEVEVSSFVSEKWVPQLGDAAELFHAIAQDKPAHRCVSALVPNEKGLDAALAVNADTAPVTIGGRLIDKVSVFTAASETFATKNTNATIDQTIDRFRPVARRAHAEGLKVRGYVSCAIACPFEGPTDPADAVRVALQLTELGIEEIDLADTIGKATPESIARLIDEAQSILPATTTLTLHLHDTFGTAIDCVRTALGMGLRSFDAALAGLGGCPYATTTEGGRAPGNLDTQALVRAADTAGYPTTCDTEALNDAAAIAHAIKQETQA